MADDPQHDSPNGEFGPTYKSLFLGACLIIGSAFGWWLTNFVSYVDTLNARLAILEIRAKEFEWTFKINTEKINSHDDRLRHLERDDTQRSSNDQRRR